MSQPRIELVFSSDDQAWMRREQIAVPEFWHGHTVPPLVGDVVRFGGRQFGIEARVWEQEGGQPLLRLFLSNARAESDTSLGALV